MLHAFKNFIILTLVACIATVFGAYQGINYQIEQAKKEEIAKINMIEDINTLEIATPW